MSWFETCFYSNVRPTRGLFQGLVRQCGSCGSDLNDWYIYVEKDRRKEKKKKPPKRRGWTHDDQHKRKCTGCQFIYTHTLLSMKTKSLSCFCLIYLLPLIPLTTPFFCHVLSYSFSISDTVLVWFTSYLTDRTQTMSVNGSKSLPAPLHYGVPQGSVLGPSSLPSTLNPFLR